MFCSFRSLRFCSNAYAAASRDSVILSFSWPSQLNHNLGLFSLDHHWFSGKITITKAAMAGWQDLDPQRVWLLCKTCELITVLCMHDHLIIHAAKEEVGFFTYCHAWNIQQTDWVQGNQSPRNTQSRIKFLLPFFTHTHTHTHRPNLSLSLPPYFILICCNFSRKRVDRVMQLLFCKVFQRSPTW